MLRFPCIKYRFKYMFWNALDYTNVTRYFQYVELVLTSAKINDNGLNICNFGFRAYCTPEISGGRAVPDEDGFGDDVQEQEDARVEVPVLHHVESIRRHRPPNRKPDPSEEDLSGSFSDLLVGTERASARCRAVFVFFLPFRTLGNTLRREL